MVTQFFGKFSRNNEDKIQEKSNNVIIPRIVDGQRRSLQTFVR